jgi:hypothetical protein
MPTCGRQIPARQPDNQKETTMQKQDTIAATMRQFMESGPKVAEFPNYKSINDHVGKLHGLSEGKCQALAGEKAWQWHADQVTGVWRKATEDEIEAKRENAAGKNHGVRAPKVMSPEDRAALDAQVTALEQVANPALSPLLADLKARQTADDAARRGSLKDRLQAAIEKTGLELAVKFLEKLIATAEAETATAETDAAEAPEA